MTKQTTFERIAVELSAALSPLQNLIGSLDEFANFLLVELGWDVNTIPQSVRGMISDIDRLVNLTKDISDTDKIDYSSLVEITATLIKIFKKIDDIKTAQDTGLLPTLIAEQFLQKLPDELLHYLLVEYLRQYHPLGYTASQLLGITSLEQVAAITAARPPHIKRKINWSYVIDILTKPQTVFKDVYDWGSDKFDFLLLGYNIADFFNALGFSTHLVQIDNSVAKVLEEKSDPETNLIKYYLKIPFALGDDNTLDTDFGIGLFPLPQNNALKPGFAILPYGNANVNSPKKITDDIFFVLQTGFKVVGGIGIVVRPDRDIKVFTGFEEGNSTASSTGSLKVGLLFTRSNNAAIRLITITEKSYLEIKSISVYGGADLSTSDRKDLFAEVELRGGKLVIGLDSADSFLSTILPAGGISAHFDLAFGISVLRNAYFRGSGGLEIQLPTHIQLGSINIQSLTISATPKADTIPINAGASVKAALGPLNVVVQNLGLTANLSFPETDGNLGPIDLDFGFKPPNSVGLSIGTGTIKGGGFLRFDPDREEYAGALELVFSDFINLKAIGIITTRMPDGSKGFSLLIIITTEFRTGIQLGYGFTLLAVGGLLGLNRTMRQQPLLDGVRTGAINRIMFPRNVVANAPQIISDLKRFFPSHNDKFLIGPMAKLGWGTPTLVSLSLGIIIEIPGNIAILGVLKVALPSDKAALLLLQVSFFGALEFDKKRFYFFAKLFESRVFFRTIEGEMGLLVVWGKDPTFIISVGGFHPRFEPPKNLPFPIPQRVRFYIINNAIARIGISGYFAVTSNTVQFGAKAELKVDIKVGGIEGHISFDTLMQVSPLQFIVDVSASVSLKALGFDLFTIRLDFSLAGPSLWSASGTGTLSISFIFFTIRISADFSKTWGKKQQTPQLSIQVMDLLKAEFEKLDNWTAHLPPGNNLSVSLRPLEATESLVLHPVGTLRISQRAIPLDLPIDKVGQQKPSDAKKFSVEVSSNGLRKHKDVSEYFARAQFQEMEDASKLSKPAFELMHSGLEISAEGEQLQSSKVVKRKVRYEEIILDTHYKRRKLPFFIELAGSESSFSNKLWFTHSLAGASISQSPLSQHYLKQRQPFEEKIVVQPENFVVAFQMNNQAFSQEAAFASEAMAQEFMQQQLAQNADLAADTLHVIPQHEVMA